MGAATVRTLLRRGLWVLPLALLLLVLPAVGGTGTAARHPAATARADDRPAVASRPAVRRATAATHPATARAGDATGVQAPPHVPLHPAPAPGSPAYRRIRQAWDAADLAEVRPAGTVWRSVPVDGVVRRYLLSVPASRTRPAPLVLAFHGLGQRAASFAAANGLVPATRAAGEVLVLPESSGPAFNDGRLGRLGPDDDAFAVAVVRQLVAARIADPRRVVVSGFSNGAGMAMEVAAEHPHLVAAVVSIDGALMDGPHAPRPTGAVDAYLVHGTADRVQPWNGRPSAGPTWPAYVSQPRTVQIWVDADSAGAGTTRELRGGSGRAAVTVQSWGIGPGGAAVTFYAVHGMGHVWPVGARCTVDATALVVHVGATAVLPGADGSPTQGA